MKAARKTFNRFIDNFSEYIVGTFIDTSPLNYKEILAIRMDRVGDDFHPFDVTVKCSGDTVSLPLFTGEFMEVDLSAGVQWDRTFATQANSSVLYLFSLAPIGRLLSTFQQRNDVGALQFAVRSEEHTSELQSLRHLVCRLLLEKKK